MATEAVQGNNNSGQTEEECERRTQEWIAVQLAAAPDFSDAQWKRFARAWGFKDTTRV